MRTGPPPYLTRRSSPPLPRSSPSSGVWHRSRAGTWAGTRTGGAGVDHVPQVGLGVGRDHTYVPGDRTPRPRESAGEVEAALVAEVDIDEHDVRLKLVGVPDRLGARRRHGHHLDPLALQERAGSLQEMGVVVDDQDSRGHRTGSRSHGAAGLALQLAGKPKFPLAGSRDGGCRRPRRAPLARR